MRKIFASLAIVLMLGGCATEAAKGPTYPVIGTVDQVKMEQAAYAARSVYAGVLHWMAEYVDLPRCGTIGATMACSSQSVVNDMRRYQVPAGAATKGAVDIARSPTKTPLALANAVADAQRAVELFRNVVALVRPAAKDAS